MRLLLCFLLCLAACGADDWAVEGGLALRRVPVKARGLDVVPVTLVAPAGGQGPSLHERSGFVLLPGGFVAPERYLWLAKSLAKRGHVVAVPEFPLELGFFTVDNARIARQLLVSGDRASGTPALVEHGSIAIGGHSLGGVVAATAAVDGGYDALVLLASYPADGDPVESLRIPVLSIAGASDCDAKPADVRAGFARFPADSALFATIPGLTHYGFTDALDEDVKAGCHGDIALERGHEIVSSLVHDFLAEHLESDAEAHEALVRGLEGATLEGAR